MVLLGVRPANGTNIIFNPGIHYIMKPEDICYYISETREEYSDFQVVKPTSFQEGLWNASATLGLLSMYVVGIDPQNFVAPSDDEETTTEQKNVILKRMMSLQGERRLSESPIHSPSRRFSMSESPPPLIPATIHEDKEEEEEDIGSLDAQITAEVSNWQEEAQVGVQLLKYHGEKNEKKPVVLLNVVPRQCSGLFHDRHSLPVCSVDHKHEVRYSSPELQPINETPSAPEIVVIDSLSDQEDAQMKEKLVHKPKSHSHTSVFNFFHHSSSIDSEYHAPPSSNRHGDYHFSDHHHGGHRGSHRRSSHHGNTHHGTGHHGTGHHGSGHHGSGHHGSDLLRKSSSFFRLNIHKNETGKLLSTCII